MKRKVIAGTIIGLVLISLVVAALYQGGGTSTYGKNTAGGAVGVIRVNGTIAGGVDAAGLFESAVGSETIMEQLRRAAADPAIKVVLLRLNTPGGTTGASQEIALEVDRLRQSGKKVVASMGDVAASGGYWIASRCDKIVANPGTITGSIGVIMTTNDLQGLYQKLGVENRVFKSGKHKDMGSPNRDITGEEQDIFQGMVDEMYEQFIATVSEGRHMDPDEVRKLADGRVFTGKQALDNGLIDVLGNYYDAIGLAAELAGIKGTPEVIELAPQRTWWETLARVKLGLPPLQSGAWFLYDPGAPGEN
ncbi:protease-4 [Desulfotomaculum arcticum]|uniref:Protease-4 n=1 Tax=Desulfotruncus arcticus DSM 17038 TaxID=1121424 RepID=A0A1I2VH75_9FIRM|nr:signal peptide peptidase SppA [Desulfotruncus arcticus]SFG87567.1 protease-4 [Desulfotomaculum arcticum] [Desulfotruncus arcticus DSM 17038]